MTSKNSRKNKVNLGSKKMIILLGQTGVGKSTFINKILGKNVAPTSPGLDSCTGSVAPFTIAGANSSDPFILVDTPGFNDTWKKDTKILEDIIEWLDSIDSPENVEVYGIIHFYDISQDRLPTNSMTATSLSNPSFTKNIVLTTSHWDNPPSLVQEKHEAELSEKYWNLMISHGSVMSRFENTQESALEVTEEILHREPLKLTTVAKEMRRIYQNIPEPSEGKHVERGFFSQWFRWPRI
ncbi:P-loop containing nucleoside triphosphate hydrolase protein [Mycena floridula]|nr:P-loop containing nucleoside triphosphate hydrolase protein [Mycena floridula]